jgi:hypothetical protein
MTPHTAHALRLTVPPTARACIINGISDGVIETAASGETVSGDRCEDPSQPIGHRTVHHGVMHSVTICYSSTPT